VLCVAFSPDGRLFAAGAGGQDRQVWLWPVDAERAAAWICASAGDGLTRLTRLTRQEWDLFVPGLTYHPVC
jgi:WD40 repeat protein